MLGGISITQGFHRPLGQHRLQRRQRIAARNDLFKALVNDIVPVSVWVDQYPLDAALELTPQANGFLLNGRKTVVFN